MCAQLRPLSLQFLSLCLGVAVIAMLVALQWSRSFLSLFDNCRSIRVLPSAWVLQRLPCGYYDDEVAVFFHFPTDANVFVMHMHPSVWTSSCLPFRLATWPRKTAKCVAPSVDFTIWNGTEYKPCPLMQWKGLTRHSVHAVCHLLNDETAPVFRRMFISVQRYLYMYATGSVLVRKWGWFCINDC